jgi:hypothetical protein
LPSSYDRTGNLSIERKEGRVDTVRPDLGLSQARVLDYRCQIAFAGTTLAFEYPGSGLAHKVLDAAGRRAVRGCDVLDEAELAAGAQDAPHFGHYLGWIADSA